MWHCIQPEQQGAWLLTQGSALYLSNNQLPQGRAADFHLSNLPALQIGYWNEQPLYLVAEQENDSREYISLRSQLALADTQFNLLQRGIELNHFVKTHRFCGKCGEKTAMSDHEWAMQCQNSACGYRAYPVICPSIIVAVRRGKEILLACHQRHKDSQIYTTLAGFVEVGETFEQTVEREVFEETGIRVKNIRYFDSQPWAFPNSQMVGFLADYESGDILLQEAEIVDAKWCHCDEALPNIPEQGTIARRLIETTLALCRQA
ncbi:MAG: NAD(+) diphosphatase [Lonepinella koalarum]|nr:NAD(+) diphosphatase [Lonepinella koalarum]